ncbi:MAG TPA: hypothetical protein PLM75_05245 [bacterium]|nr:hypothetical protein [bacterium]
MKKYCVYSTIIQAASNNVETTLLAAFDNIDDAQIMLANLYEKNRFSADIRDAFFDGKVLTMFNTAANCYSNYKIKEIEN